MILEVACGVVLAVFFLWALPWLTTVGLKWFLDFCVWALQGYLTLMQSRWLWGSVAGLVLLLASAWWVVEQREAAKAGRDEAERRYWASAVAPAEEQAFEASLRAPAPRPGSRLLTAEERAFFENEESAPAGAQAQASASEPRPILDPFTMPRAARLPPPTMDGAPPAGSSVGVFAQQPVLDPITDQSLRRTVNAAMDPQRALERIAQGTHSPQDLEAIRTVYPQTYKRFQMAASAPRAQDFAASKRRVDAYVTRQMKPIPDPLTVQRDELLTIDAAGPELCLSKREYLEGVAERYPHFKRAVTAWAERRVGRVLPDVMTCWKLADESGFLDRSYAR